MKHLTRKFIILSTLASLALVGCADIDDVDDNGEIIDSSSAEATVRARFDLFKAHNDQFYFNLEAGNGATLLSSEGYKTRTGALGGILSVLDNGGLESRYEVFQGNDSQYYVRLTAGNSQIIAVSEGYASKQNAGKAVKSSIAAVATHLEFWSKPTGVRFEVSESGNQFRFALHAGNGQVVLSSENYTTEAGCLNGAFSVAENGLDASNYEVREAQSGEFYVVLKAQNNQIIAISEMYSTKSNATRAINDFVALMPEAQLL